MHSKKLQESTQIITQFPLDTLNANGRKSPTYYIQQRNLKYVITILFAQEHIIIVMKIYIINVIR